MSSHKLDQPGWAVHLGYAATAWAGAAMTLVALAFVGVSLRLHSRSRVVMGALAAEPASTDLARRV
ncbi:hypothetical protein [Streptomyces sp. H72]